MYNFHMPNYRRAYVPGGTFFFTVVTARRARFLCEPSARQLLRSCLRQARQRRSFTIEAAVLLPDHLHMIWTLPNGDTDFSTRWADIKGNFTRHWLRLGGREQDITKSQAGERRRGVWQRRFMEHCIRDEDDLIAHVEYIHYNPVKHGLVARPCDWPWSSFHRYVKVGVYAHDWGCVEPKIAPRLVRVERDLLE